MFVAVERVQVSGRRTWVPKEAMRRTSYSTPWRSKVSESLVAQVSVALRPAWSRSVGQEVRIRRILRDVVARKLRSRSE